MPDVVKVPNFVAIGQTVAEIWRFSDFSMMAAVCHLGFVIHVLTIRERHLVVFITAQSLVGIDTFDNRQVFTFCDLCLKTPIPAPEIGGVEQNRGRGGAYDVVP